MNFRDYSQVAEISLDFLDVGMRLMHGEFYDFAMAFFIINEFSNFRERVEFIGTCSCHGGGIEKFLLKKWGQRLFSEKKSYFKISIPYFCTLLFRGQSKFETSYQ